MPTTLAALRRLIADKNYWNPRDMEYEERQRLVREGFEHLYPRHKEARPPIVVVKEGEPEYHEKDREEAILHLRQRWFEVFEEYGELAKSHSYPIPDTISERMRELEAEREEIEQDLETYGAPLPHQGGR